MASNDSIRINVDADLSDLESGLASLEKNIRSSMRSSEESVRNLTDKLSGLCDQMKLAKETADSSKGGGFFEEIPQSVDKINSLYGSFSTLKDNVKEVSDTFSKSQKFLVDFTSASDLAYLKENALAGELGICDMALGLLTGKITLATIAQTALNLVMSANPIALVVAGVAGLIGVFSFLSSQQQQVKTDAEILAETNEALGTAFGNVGEAANAYNEGLSNAQSYLSNFDLSLFATAEEQQNLHDKMAEMQEKFLETCHSGMDADGQFTEAAVENMKTYYEEIQKLNKEKLEMEEERTKALQQQAQTEAEAYQGSLEGYKTLSQEWIATAQEQAENEKKLIEEQTTQELVMLNQRFGDKATLANAEYKKEYEALMDKKQTEIDAANANVAEVTNAYAEGYQKRAEGFQGHLDEMSALGEQQAAETQQYNDTIKRLDDEYALYSQQSLNGDVGARLEADEKLGEIRRQREEEEQRHTAALADMQKGFLGNLDENTQQQLGEWMAMLADTELYGGKISDKNQDIVDSILASYNNMDEESKGQMKEMMEGMMAGLNEKEGPLYNKVSNIGGTMLQKLKDTFQIKSPSRKTREIFRYVMEGAEIGMEEKKPKLLGRTTDIAEKTLQRFDMEALSGRMRNAVSLQRMLTSNAVSAAETRQFALRPDFVEKISNFKSSSSGMAEVHLDIDGREFAVVTAPYLSKEMAFQG